MRYFSYALVGSDAKQFSADNANAYQFLYPPIGLR